MKREIISDETIETAVGFKTRLVSRHIEDVEMVEETKIALNESGKIIISQGNGDYFHLRWIGLTKEQAKRAASLLLEFSNR